jgi:hypothetical protein
MTKKASRAVNPKHPAVNAFAALVKLANGGVALNRHRDEVGELLDAVNQTLVEVMRATSK